MTGIRIVQIRVDYMHPRATKSYPTSALCRDTREIEVVMTRELEGLLADRVQLTAASDRERLLKELADSRAMITLSQVREDERIGRSDHRAKRRRLDACRTLIGLLELGQRPRQLASPR